jgi:hypothetical protein
MLVIYVGIMRIPMSHTFPYIILVTGNWVEYYNLLRHAYVAKSGVNHGNWLTCLWSV